MYGSDRWGWRSFFFLAPSLLNFFGHFQCDPHVPIDIVACGLFVGPFLRKSGETDYIHKLGEMMDLGSVEVHSCGRFLGLHSTTEPNALTPSIQHHTHVVLKVDA